MRTRVAPQTSARRAAADRRAPEAKRDIALSPVFGTRYTCRGDLIAHELLLDPLPEACLPDLRLDQRRRFLSVRMVSKGQRERERHQHAQTARTCRKRRASGARKRAVRDRSRAGSRKRGCV